MQSRDQTVLIVWEFGRIWDRKVMRQLQDPSVRERRLELRQIRAVLERESKNSKKGKGSWGNERVTARTTTTIIFLDLHYTPAQTVEFLKLLWHSFPNYPPPYSQRSHTLPFQSSHHQPSYVHVITYFALPWIFRLFEVDGGNLVRKSDGHQPTRPRDMDDSSGISEESFFFIHVIVSCSNLFHTYILLEQQSL